MRILKSHPLLKMVNSYLIDSPQPSNISYLWNFGSLLSVCLVIQIITGVTLAMHYIPNIFEAFDSVEHIMRDVNNGWLIRYLHSNTASAFFFLVYLHIGRGLYYGSYRAPRTLVWTIGTVIFILMMATAFLGYVLPYGQMSLWGATVITNLMSAIPWVGQDIVQFIWGGFSVNNATLNRFFALHYVLPFVLAALALMHLITLHDSAGSGNPLGISGNCDRLPFSPYFIFKDLVTIFLFFIILSIFVFFIPNALGDSENYVMANPMQTPPAIVPEWYLLPFYAILRSIPNKLLGVIAMFSAILALLVMPYTDLSKMRGIAFKPLSKIAFYVFVANFLILMQLGAKHVESPFIEFGQFSTALYFAHFLIIVPIITSVENTLMDLGTVKSVKVKKTKMKTKFKKRLKELFVPNGFIISWIAFNISLLFLPLNYITFNYINYPLIIFVILTSLCIIRNLIIQLFVIKFISSDSKISFKSTFIACILSLFKLTYFSNYYDIHCKQNLNRVHLTQHQEEMARVLDGIVSKDFIRGTQGFFEIKERLINILDDWKLDYDLGRDCNIHRQNFNNLIQNNEIPRLPYSFGTVREITLPQENMGIRQYRQKLSTTKTFIQKVDEWREVCIENYAKVCKERYPNVKVVVLEYHCRHNVTTFITPEIALELSVKDYDFQEDKLVNRRIEYPNLLI